MICSWSLNYGFRITTGGPVYFPNSFNGPRIDPETLEPIGPLVQGYSARIDSGDEDNFSHARKLLEVDVGADEKNRIALRIAKTLIDVLPTIRGRVLVNCIYPLGKEFGDIVLRSLQNLEAHHATRNASIYLSTP